MKRQIILSVILLATLFSSLNMFHEIFPSVHATYVEGLITKDTLWSRVDSPFVLSNDVIVSPAATLTIEPGVQVRFGEGFSLTVNGAIQANGTEEDMILFTTNDPSDEILWHTIEINGSKPSLLNNCIFERATNGATLTSGALDLQNCIVRSNFENGIAVRGGNLTLHDNVFVNNEGNAIGVFGGDQASIYNNTIDLNLNGIELSGQLTGTISIMQNTISSNTEAGLVLGEEWFISMVIEENNVSSNRYGFLVTTDASTHLTHNTVFNNSIGFHYSGEGNHFADFNDIFENELGMDVDPQTSVHVNASHNFWGDSSGPLHTSLNPYAKGNMIEGSGERLDFTPFLTHPFVFLSINSQPTAVLWSDKVLVAPNQPVTFVGTDSQDDGSVWQYLFVFGDGTNSGWTTLSLFNHTYLSTGTYQASLMVEDDFGVKSATSFATIDVVNLSPLQVSISTGNGTIPFNGETLVTVRVSNASSSVANAQVTMFSVKGGTFESQSGVTDQNGYFTTTFTAPNVEQATDIRIIARASMSGYADGSNYKYAKILPPLAVQITPATPEAWSEETITLGVQVANVLDEPVAGADLTVSCSQGRLSPVNGSTDTNGRVTFTFTAPLTLSPLNVTLTVKTSKSGYADTQSETYISIEPKTLLVEITATPDALLSNEASTITARVTFDSKPVSDAAVKIASDAGGNFSVTEASTDYIGIARFAYSAPPTSVPEGVNVTITARATKDTFVEGGSQITVLAQPKVMFVNIMPFSNSTFSAANLNVTVHAEYNSTPIQGANVTITASDGVFTPTSVLTDRNGNSTLTFTSPEADESSNVTFYVTVTKEGYLKATSQIDLPVKPRTFLFQVTPSTVTAGQRETLTIHLTCKEDGSVADAVLVTLSYPGGQSSENVTDIDGTCMFTLNIPQTSDNELNITVVATRIGYQEKQVILALNVTPSQGGLSWWIILAMVIPVAVAIIVAVLIKKRVILVSSKEGEPSRSKVS